MTLKTGRKCSWDEIEVGEVFAVNGCWEVFYKMSNKEAFLLSCNHNFWISGDLDGVVFVKTGRGVLEETKNHWGVSDISKIYKLPPSVQRLWKEE